MKDLFRDILQQNLPPASWQWLQEKAAAIASEKEGSSQLYLAFSMAPRKTGKERLRLTEEQEASLREAYPHHQFHTWTADRLARVWLLLQADASDPGHYQQCLDELFRSAEMNELVALYSALPFLSWPETWAHRCTEGIRSNIGTVLEAIMCNNPYPSLFLDDAAWNQLVLKAVFTGKDLDQVVGLQDRANQELAWSLSDLARERWAAGRPVDPKQWSLVAPFLDARIFPDIEKLAQSDNPDERQAAAGVCRSSNYPPAKVLLTQLN